VGHAHARTSPEQPFDVLVQLLVTVALGGGFRADDLGFLERLRNFRVLDPDCGSVNFLYLALKTLKDIEHRANIEAEGLGLQRRKNESHPLLRRNGNFDREGFEAYRTSVAVDLKHLLGSTAVV
jgi:hypothetical protein